MSTFLSTLLLAVSAGCRSTASAPIAATLDRQALPASVDSIPPSTLRDGSRPPLPTLGSDSEPDRYLEYALLNNPAVEAAYQRWRADAQRSAQVGSLPDPRLTLGYFAEEVETRVGPQQAKIGLSQTFPWPGQLGDRAESAASRARAAWRRFEAERLAVIERVVTTLHELRYLDRSIAITRENLALLRTFEGVVRSRYRVGMDSHPELIRVQVELGLLEDRLDRGVALRPSLVAELNTVLNRPTMTPVAEIPELPGRVVVSPPEDLLRAARESSPLLLALTEGMEEQRSLERAARKDGLPTFTLGLDYIFTGQAKNRAIAESGDDPVLVTLGFNLPIWRRRIDAGALEATSRRHAIGHERADLANRIATQVQRAWVDHTDADRRVLLYEKTLIPKAEESLQASLAGFRAGDARFLDLLDTERTLLEFTVAAERARAERGQALARLEKLVGEPLATRTADDARPVRETEDRK